jgi:6-phosphogluconolactonase/glucosamine-6-phosphate isomerase/deaminase
MAVNFFNSTDDAEISKKAFKILYEEIKNRKKINILISGGNSLKKFFTFLIGKKVNMNSVSFILSDERIVNKKSIYSNILMIKNELINKINKEKKPNFIYPSITNAKVTNKKLCSAYNNKIKILPTLAFLGVGHDGHIASIFYSNSNIQYSKAPFLICKKKDEKFKRISVDMEFLINIPKLIIIILDKNKHSILKHILNYKKQVSNLPILHLLNKSKGHIYVLYNKKILSENYE